MNTEISRSKLNHAIFAGDYAATKSLLEAGVDANEADRFGVPLIFQAVSLGRSRIVGLLQIFGADMSVKDFSGKTPLDLAIFYGNDFVIEIIFESRTNHAKNDKNQKAKE